MLRLLLLNILYTQATVLVNINRIYWNQYYTLPAIHIGIYRLYENSLTDSKKPNKVNKSKNIHVGDIY